MISKETVFKGHPILVLEDENGKRKFSAGIKKISIIVENIEALKAFREKYIMPEREASCKKS